MFILRILCIFFMSHLYLHANPVIVNEDKHALSILDKSQILVTDKKYNIDEIIHQKFQPFSDSYINLGITNKEIWVKFTLENQLSTPVQKLLVIENPMLLSIDLYRQDANKICQIHQKRKTLSPSYLLNIPPHAQKTFYLHIQHYTTLKFGLNLYDKETYFQLDKGKELTGVMLIGIVLTLMIYNFLLFLYVRESSNLYYSIYLLLVLWLEITYVGFTPLYFSKEFAALDSSLIVAKVNLLFIFYTLYAITFLNLHKFRKFYIFLIVSMIVSLFLIFSTGFSYALSLQLSLKMIMVIIVLIYIAAFISYRNGYTEARFFIMGFSVVFGVYCMMILDALGLFSIIHHIQNILLIATAIEAIFLTLAFFDKYKIIQEEKLNKEHKLLEESQKREQMIEKEVALKTDQIQHALNMQDLLFNELHHRVKNNLQLILSITRMQKATIADTKCQKSFGSLERRISAIAATHNTIYLSKELEIVSMKEYIIQLTQGLKAGVMEDKIEFVYNIDLHMTLKRAINVGLIVNEVVSNAIKYAFPKGEGKITILMRPGYIEISDNGVGFDTSKQKKESLGMKLVHILVKDQLKGTLTVDTSHGTKIIIRFKHV